MCEVQYYFTPLLDPLENFDENSWYLHPVVTLSAAEELLERSGLSHNIQNLNAFFDHLQKIALDFLVVSLYGRKISQQFMLCIQKKLTISTLLNYDEQLRERILQELHLSSEDFEQLCTFNKNKLKEILEDFQDQHFEHTPSSLIFTDSECLKLPVRSHHELKSYLTKIQRTA